jgi:flagellar motility protein MotE (MotC chaperone)
MNSLRSSRTLKVVVVVKLIAIVAILGTLDGTIHFGDKPLTAAEGEAAAPAPEETSEPKAEAPAEKPAEEAGKTRKSFLSNLLELPALNPEKLQKEEMGKYLELAERKHRQVEERLNLLQRREDQLKTLENSIDDKLRRLDEERRFFSQTIQQEKDLKGERLDKLVTMYAKMEPKKAAPVVEKLDKDLVVELFKQIPQKQITAILETMNPDKSVEISEYYGRVRSAREYDLLKEMNTSLRKEFDECKGMPAGKVAE